MVQFLSINFICWISSIFVGVFKSFRFFVSPCSILGVTRLHTTRILVIDVPASTLATPPLRLQKHNDLRAREFAHWPHLWHELRLANCRCAWCRRLCEITPTIHVSVCDLDFSAIPSGVLRHLKQNLRSAYGDREDFYCIFVTGLYNYSYLRT